MEVTEQQSIQVNKTVFVSGGTGSFGRAMTEYLLTKTDSKVRVYSRDEAKHENMMQQFPSSARLTYILGDVRDVVQLTHSIDGCNVVIHAAALKRVGFGQQNVEEFSKTNEGGSRNVINAALACGVGRSVLISSDKAVNAINAYGKTKAVAEELFIQANKKGVSRGCAFSAVRGGNVWASAGSVIPFWRAQLLAGERLSVTVPDATRFNLLMADWTAFVWWAVGAMRGGEIFCPKPPAWRLADLAEAMAPAGWRTIGPRDGDKQNESLISADEAARTVDAGSAYVIEPPEALRDVWNYRPWAGYPMHPGWAFTSDTACRMKLDELIRLVRQL